MRIHSGLLTQADFEAACRVAGTKSLGCQRHGSRSHGSAFEFSMSGSGTWGGQWGSQDYKAATWDEWGIVLNHLFTVDPTTKCRAYENALHFHWTTSDRFKNLQAAQKHVRHRWTRGLPHGTYSEATCLHRSACNAQIRWPIFGRTWNDIAADYFTQVFHLTAA